ncbi:MAG: hypothetical protein QG597_5269 [Actinomycetota bacterium]|nr:hypothetical protein [Actinomycetota bacterium]
MVCRHLVTCSVWKREDECVCLPPGTSPGPLQWPRRVWIAHDASCLRVSVGGDVSDKDLDRGVLDVLDEPLRSLVR